MKNIINEVRIQGKLGKYSISGVSNLGVPYWYGKLIVDTDKDKCVVSVDVKAFGEAADRMSDFDTGAEVVVNGFLSNQLDKKLSELQNKRYYNLFVQIKSVKPFKPKKMTYNEDSYNSLDFNQDKADLPY